MNTQSQIGNAKLYLSYAEKEKNVKTRAEWLELASAAISAAKKYNK